LILSEFAAKDSPEPSHGLPPADSGRQPGIAIKAWDPDTPYLKALRAAPDDTAFAVYMKQRGDYGKSPAFFLDCAEHFSGRNNPTLALQVLSNLAELELEDATLLRVLGHRLAQTGQLELAVLTFEEVLRLRPEEPQSYRDLALVLARRADLVAMPKSTAAPGGRPVSGPAAPGSSSAQPGPEAKAAALADYVRAIGLLKEVVLKPWDGRFPEIEVIALEELNRTASWASLVGLQRVDLDPRLVQRMDVDIRIVMTWHADATDIDLWVTEPSDEKAFYGHNRTTIGGLVSSDFTGGYGPEEYMVRSAMRGMYKIEANYFGSRASRLLGPVTVQVDVFTNYGRMREQRKSLTLRLTENKETVKIGEVEF
jgi:tetratricopeptide (TPR) repeat protein